MLHLGLMITPYQSFCPPAKKSIVPLPHPTGAESWKIIKLLFIWSIKY